MLPNYDKGLGFRVYGVLLTFCGSGELPSLFVKGGLVKALNPKTQKL